MWLRGRKRPFVAYVSGMSDSDQSGRSGRSARRASGTRKKLLDAAAEMFNTVGFDACTIEDITERADVGKGTFYRHFEDKYAIITTLVESALADLRRQMHAPRDSIRQTQDAVLHLFDTHAAVYNAQPDVAFLLFQGRMQLRFRRGQAEGIEQAFHAYFADVEQLLAPHLGGSRDPLRMRTIACTTVGAIWGFISAANVGMRKDEIGRALASVRQPYLAGILEMLK